MKYQFDFTDKVVLVTGASRGLGRAYACGFAGLGAKLVLSGRDEKMLEETAELVRQEGCEDYQIIPCDVLDTKAMDHLIEEIDRLYGRLDILVNNAGVGHKIPAVNVSPEEWQRVIGTNLDAPFYLSSRVAQRFMIPQNGGNIINIASMGGFSGIPGGAAYSASKAGLLNLTRSLAGEWAKNNVRVNCVCPHYTETDMVKPLMAYEQWMKLNTLRTPLGRLAQPEETVGAVLFLASDMASYITGDYIQVDGGSLGVAY
ncbi:MAG TPA: SDR family oxidoreductase [Thermotogota bacterium]|nr:SDR family oxidoreductase [Thermotogota bacterium]HPJ90072.1 SDR family oxidoreductase [Thermotogota bacterium]HPR96871.1 SDR family oxidoreductase [Thermotogota bacterium]